MIVQCAWCRRPLGTTPDAPRWAITHSICNRCKWRQKAKLAQQKRTRLKMSTRGMNPRKRKWDVGERVQFRRDGSMVLPAHRHLNAGIGSALWGGAKAGYYTYRAGRLEGKAKRYREKARASFQNPRKTCDVCFKPSPLHERWCPYARRSRSNVNPSRLIPGHALEVRYRRATDGKLYYHPFEGPVKMVANADGSVTLRGSKRIWADDREAGFWDRYGHPKRRRNPGMARRRRRGKDNTMLWLIGGAAAFFFWPQISQALGLSTGAVSTGGQSIIPQGNTAIWYSDPYQGGGGEFFTGSLPPGSAPPWRLASATEIGMMESGLLSGSLAQAGGGLVAPAPGFLT